MKTRTQVPLTVHVDIVSAERQIFSGLAKMVVAPTKSGEIGILPRHAPLLAQLRPGLVRVITATDQEHEFFVSSGFLEVQPNIITVLADSVLRNEDMDRAAAVTAIERVSTEMKQSISTENYEKLKNELHFQMMLLRIIDDVRGRRRG
jgi:F-type H+-transporting ATPase subunit epsilon